MIGLLRTYLAPYKAPIALALLLLLVGAIGNLYLPDLNADIIDNGVVKGDTDYILRVGAMMLVVTAILGVASVVGGVHRRAGRDGLRPRRSTGGLLDGRDVLAGRGQPLRRAVAHHPEHE